MTENEKLFKYVLILLFIAYSSNVLSERKEQKLVLIGFPHAGGFAMYYVFLRKHEYHNIDKIFVFDYPRKNFTFDGSSADFQRYIDVAVDYIKMCTAGDDQYILFGHSMGAFVACEAGLAMQNVYGKPPVGVIVSGQNPPYAVTCGKHTEMPSDLLAFAKKLGGVPQKILDNPQMCEKLYKFAETDMKAVSTYVPTVVAEGERLNCGMLLRGADDFIVDPMYHDDWNKTFKQIYLDKVFDGSHFYFDNNQDEIASLIDEFAGAVVNEGKHE